VDIDEAVEAEAEADAEELGAADEDAADEGEALAIEEATPLAGAIVETPEMPEGCDDEAVAVAEEAELAELGGLDAALDASVKKPTGRGVGLALALDTAATADDDDAGVGAGATDAAELTLAGALDTDAAAAVGADEAATGSAAAAGME